MLTAVRCQIQAISNVRAIRAMGFENAFREKFDAAVDSALSTGVRGAFVEGCSYGVASALIYLAEALLFYVGAVLIANGTFSYLQMIQTLQLVVFSVSIGSQLMAFSTSCLLFVVTFSVANISYNNSSPHREVYPRYP